jgi:GNAT superfamily N-acetyltransferase
MPPVSDPWAWTQPIHDRHFGAKLAGRYRVEPVSAERYWDELVPAWRDSWPPEVYFDFESLQSQGAAAGAARLRDSRGVRALRGQWRALDGDRQVALFSGGQRDDTTWLMTHAQVHPDERGKGIYSAIVRLIIDYTAELGFQQIVSSHSPSNNAVIVPKLRAGFLISAVEVDAAHGTSIILTYFHDPAQRAAFAFRAGDAVLTPALIGAGRVGMDRLREQFQEGSSGQEG